MKSREEIEEVINEIEGVAEEDINALGSDHLTVLSTLEWVLSDGERLPMVDLDEVIRSD